MTMCNPRQTQALVSCTDDVRPDCTWTVSGLSPDVLTTYVPLLTANRK